MQEAIDQRGDAVQSEVRVDPLSEQLRRERQLARSTGTISKPVMAVAFGVVFILIGSLVAASHESLRELLPASLTIGVGVISAIWGAYALAWRSTRSTRISRSRARLHGIFQQQT